MNDATTPPSRGDASPHSTEHATRATDTEIGELSSADTAPVSAEARATKAEADLALLREQVDAEKRARADAERKLERADLAAREAAHEARTHQDLALNLKRQLADAQKDVAGRNHELAETRNRLAAAEAQSAALADKVTGLQRELADAEADLVRQRQATEVAAQETLAARNELAKERSRPGFLTGAIVTGGFALLPKILKSLSKL